ncbi:MAG: hypothetical protein A2X31_03755 [Elusimicrobia bacterium GWB2_63_22]|nr:MAG: hypothetical protein A2X31_03755 [Elusimicrobia bacterium GWB2_63_22]
MFHSILKTYVMLFWALLGALPLCADAAEGAYSPARYKAQKKELRKAVALWRRFEYPLACAKFKQLGQRDNPVAYYFYSNCIVRNSLSLKARAAADNLRKAAFPGIRQLAEAGDDLAQYALGRMYSYGEGTQKNAAEGVKWSLKSALQGNPEAQCNIGYAYAQGKGLEMDEKKAAEWYRRAADNGSPIAQYNLGTRYESGLGVRADKEEAFRLYKLAAAQGAPGAQYRLAQAYEDGGGVEKDRMEAFRLYGAAANSGFGSAQYKLGLLYDSGEVVPKNPAAALKWWCLTANHNPEAQSDMPQVIVSAKKQIILATCQKPGSGSGTDGAAAAQGDAAEQYKLAEAYQNGSGVKPDRNEAFRLYRLAADAGYPPAQYKLALGYAAGEAVPKNSAEALRLLCLAAGAGYEPAEADLVRDVCAE